MRVLRRLLFLLFLLASGNPLLYAIEPEWEFLHEKHGIRLYKRDLPDTKIHEFKGETVIDAGIDVIGAALRDVPAYPTWMPDCKQIRFIEKFDEENFIIYQIQKTPWPVIDRDAVVQVSTVIEREAGRFTVTLRDIEDPRIPPKENLVRIAHLYGEWIVEAIDRDRSRVNYRFTVDPSGSLPIKTINANVQKAPYTTLLALQEVVRTPFYHDMAKRSPDDPSHPLTKDNESRLTFFRQY